MENKIINLIKKQEDVLILMKELNIQKTELAIENGQSTIKHWMERLKE